MLCYTDGIPKGDKKTLFQTEGWRLVLDQSVL